MSVHDMNSFDKDGIGAPMVLVSVMDSWVRVVGLWYRVSAKEN